MRSAVATRLSSLGNYAVNFSQTVVATYRGQKLNLIDALIASVKVGAPVTLQSDSGPIKLVVGMVDLKNEPWNKERPLFYGYQFKGDSFEKEADIVTMWLGETTTKPRQVVLREIRELIIPATTMYVGCYETKFERRDGFMNYIHEAEELPAFDLMAEAAKTGKPIHVNAQRLVAGLGFAQFPYTMLYLPTQFERAYPWMHSAGIWDSRSDEETNRRLYHGGFALMNWGVESKPKYMAARAAGYFFTTTSRGGSFRHEEGSYEFSDDSFGGLLAAS